jgi:hypothetical protein
MNHQKDNSLSKGLESRKPEATSRDMSEVNFGAILFFGLGLVLVGVAIYILMPVLFRHLNEREARSEIPRSPLLSHDQLRLPPEPRLQLAPDHAVHPLEELKQLRATEDGILNSYGWVDQKAGTVRIPIELAKQLILQRGLPNEPQGVGDRDIPQVSSSGRTWQRRD